MTHTLPPEPSRHYTTAEVIAITGFKKDVLCDGIKDKDPGVMALGPVKIRQSIRWPKARVDSAFPPLAEEAS